MSEADSGWRLNLIFCSHKMYNVGIFFRICLSLSTVSSRVCPLLIAFCLFTVTFVRIVLLVLLVYVHHSLPYKYPPGVLL
jgi:hypothetical protein